MERASLRRIAVLACAGAMFVACADGGDEGTRSSTETAPDDGDIFTGSGSEESATYTGQDAAPVVESIPPVPETGVPGIASDDAFCRAWSQYAGSVQALSLAWAVQPAAAAAALEVAASDAVTSAVAAMSAEFPADIESNRDALTVDVPGPILDRAERARQALADAGGTDDEIKLLGDAWIEAIAAAGLDAENVAVAVADDLQQILSTATGPFLKDTPSILEDPTLDTTEFDITPSLDYIFENCPDRGTLAGNDVVGSES
ncbi:MAG: hypothetical protein GKR86_03050 [Ilumatobacter sp.]|nr:hypothetical protein [Ilumatobacter sp.]